MARQPALLTAQRFCAILSWLTQVSSGRTYYLGLGSRFHNLPKTNSTHDCVARKGGWTTGSGHRKRPNRLHLPPGDASALGSCSSSHVALPGYHSPNLVLGGAPSWSTNPSGHVMITATDLKHNERPEVILKTLGNIHTQQMLGNPGEPEGADWATNPVTLHWCRDQDLSSTEVCRLTYTSSNTCLPVNRSKKIP